MADGFAIQVKGGAALRRKLRELADKDVKAVMRKALRAGAKVVLPEARSNAPVLTGKLKRNIRVRSAKRSRRYVGATVTTSEGFFKGDDFYTAFQEFGWRKGKRGPNAWRINKKGKRVRRRSKFQQIAFGRVPGKHFMERAARSKGKAAGDVVVSTAWRLLKFRALMRGGLGGGAV